MPLIKNFDQLATTQERKVVLELVEAGLSSVQPTEEVSKRHKNDWSVVTQILIQARREHANGGLRTGHERFQPC